MGWLAVGRAAGVLVFLFALVMAIALAVLRRPGSVPAGLVAAAGLAAAALADAAVRRAVRRQARARRNGALAKCYRADLKAWKTGCLLFFALLMLWIGAWMTWSEEADGRLIGWAVVVAAAGTLPGLLLLIVQRWRVGYLLQLDRQGLHACALPPVAWQDIHRLDLQQAGDERELVVVTGPAIEHDLACQWWAPLFFWPLARLDASRRRLRVPLAFVDGDPGRVLSVAQGLARQAGRLR
jgi:hypothetical protein